MAAPDRKTGAQRRLFAGREVKELMESTWMAAVEVLGVKVMGMRVMGVTHVS